MNKMVDWSQAAARPWLEEQEQISGRLAELLALLTAINAGELLGELPQEPSARVRHNAGVSLLAVLERELTALVAEVERSPPPA